MFNTKKGTDFFAVCPHCYNFLGLPFEVMENSIVCSNCNMQTEYLNLSDPSFFAIIDPSSKIADLLEAHEDYYDSVMNRTPQNDNELHDIYDGELYKNL